MSLGTEGIRINMEAVINSLNDGSLPPETAKEICNAAGKYLNSIKIDLAGEVVRHKIPSYQHDAIQFSPSSAIEKL